MRVRVDFIWGSISFIVLAVSLSAMGKGLFVVSGYTGDDGFYRQVMPFLSSVSFTDLHVLQYVHFLRYLVVSPFIFGEVNDLGGGYFAIIILLFSLPILSAMKKGEYGMFRYVILLVPIFFSFRVFLVACSIAYLFIAIYHHKSIVLMLASLLISVLSSAVVMVWILIFIINFRSLVKDYRMAVALLSGMIVVVFLPSFWHKVEYANEVLLGYSDYLLRGTLVVSFLERQWARLAFYIACLMIVFLIASRSLLPGNYRIFYLSYTSFIVGAVFEGAGLICGLIVVILFLSGFRPESARYMLIRGLDEKS